MTCEIHGPYEGPECRWCVTDGLAMTWQCDMCGKWTSERTLKDHELCDDARWVDEMAELRAWTYR